MRKVKKVYSYQINLIAEEESGYTVLVPLLPGCISYGRTIEQATENAREAIHLHLDNLAAHKEPASGDTERDSKLTESGRSKL